MRIAFYAPLKSPNHPVPSGDRLMARLLMRAMERAGHGVDLASELRSRTAAPENHAAVASAAAAEIVRLTADWRRVGAPDLFFCYHLYYKSPDFIGPPLCRAFGIPYVTAEASMSPRRSTDAWAGSEAVVREAFRQAALSICFTARDRDGALRIMPALRTAMLAPFIDPGPPTPLRGSTPPRLMAVAMMRAGDKMESYRILAQALASCAELPWTVSVVGDGVLRPEVEALFAGLWDRVEWLGELAPADLPSVLARGDLYVWPGIGEAYGLAYLEAQAAGLPVVAQAVAGVPEVVRDGETGILTAANDIVSYAAAVRRLLQDTALRKEMSARARRFVNDERSLDQAAVTLKTILARFEPA